MGYSITQEKWERLEALRREGRLCCMDREHVTKATVMVTQESWTYKIGEGESHVDEMPFCPRHARQVPEGYEGVNFRVLSHRKF
jgi:hypothetical protein